VGAGFLSGTAAEHHAIEQLKRVRVRGTSQTEEAGCQERWQN